MSRVEPIHAESSSEKLYANTVTVEPVHKGDNSTATRLSVNFGNRSSFMNPDKEIYTENRTNDYSATLNIGYVYYFN